MNRADVVDLVVDLVDVDFDVDLVDVDLEVHLASALPAVFQVFGSRLFWQYFCLAVFGASLYCIGYRQTHRQVGSSIDNATRPPQNTCKYSQHSVERCKAPINQ